MILRSPFRRIFIPQYKYFIADGICITAEIKFLLLSPVLFYKAPGHKTLGFFFSPKNNISFPDIPGCIDSETSDGVTLHGIRLFLSAITGYPFSYDVFQKSFLTGFIKFQYKVRRSFIAVGIENRTGKINLEEKYFI